MGERLFTISEVTARLGVTPQTVRAYCSRFGGLMSDYASPPAGQVRRFTEKDVRILALIRDKTGDRNNPDVVGTVSELVHRDELPPLPLPLDQRVGLVVQSAQSSLALEMAQVEKEALQAEVEWRKERITELEEALSSVRHDYIASRDEIGDLKAELAEAKTMLRLYEEGRLRPVDKT